MSKGLTPHGRRAPQGGRCRSPCCSLRPGRPGRQARPARSAGAAGQALGRSSQGGVHPEGILAGRLTTLQPEFLQVVPRLTSRLGPATQHRLRHQGCRGLCSQPSRVWDWEEGHGGLAGLPLTGRWPCDAGAMAPPCSRLLPIQRGGGRPPPAPHLSPACLPAPPSQPPSAYRGPQSRGRLAAHQRTSPASSGPAPERQRP